jgi:predicted flap endonuclease-1-like 5' DNA nuclease
VRSAQVEHYKKYQEWLGDGEPPSGSFDLPVQTVEPQAVSESASEKIVERNGEASVETLSERQGDLDQAGVVVQTAEGQAVGESPDDLKQIRGVGPALERFLHKRGVFWFSQVATWSQADIDKFEFLLPNFGGRIQRENWVCSAQLEHYKKYQQWLGEGEPPSESLDLPAQMDESQAVSSQAEGKTVETIGEPSAVETGVQPVKMCSERQEDLDQASPVESLAEENQTAGESPDDLKRIRGVGPELERFLHKRGIFWFSQVATWSQADIDKFEFLLPNFGGRIQRENWVHSARVEYYKKHQQWLGDGEPPSTTPEMR